uniref:Uncharacterized protein n=1 Tax=Oryza brachyantha TaxID=4533 RepID=J3LL63_ORYBR
ARTGARARCKWPFLRFVERARDRLLGEQCGGEECGRVVYEWCIGHKILRDSWFIKTKLARRKELY